MTDETPTTLGDTTDRCPYGYYAAARDRGDATYEEQASAWIVPTYAGVKRVFTDEDTFARPTPIDIVQSEKYVPIMGGPRHNSALVGQERLDHRKWWLGLFNRSAIEAYRSGLITDVIDTQINRIASAGRAELVEDYTGRVSIRVIAGVLGLPWDDDDWMSQLRKRLDMMEHYKSIVFLKPAEALEMADATLAATAEVNELIRPFMERARDAADDTIMSRIWHDESLEAWNESDKYGIARTFFSAGSDTTRTQMSNALYILLTQPSVAEQVRDAEPAVVANFIEEALRLHGTVHFRARNVTSDTEIGGHKIRAGENVVGVMASANRDELQYPQADSVNLNRPNPRSHIAFSTGIGACAGASLARAELQEGVSRLVNRLRDLRLDDDAEAPFPEGLLFRLYRPLNVTFTPES